MRISLALLTLATASAASRLAPAQQRLEAWDARSSRAEAAPQATLHDIYDDHDEEQRWSSPVIASEAANASLAGGPALAQLLDAVDVLQDRFFETWQGTWPAGIDWTRAVVGTQVSGALRAVSRAAEFAPCSAGAQAATRHPATENTLAGHFSQVAAFYFGENALELRGQAFDDMLWVVLGWLEAVRLVDEHSAAHFDDDRRWFAQHFVPAFAHRARVFWDLAREGWGTRLCGGGMNWNPRLQPYKNAITNELFIAASVSMYLHFPGDSNGFPFSQAGGQARGGDTDELPVVGKHDEKYLHMARRGYDWLMASNMTNAQGLFVDGFHIGRGTTECTERNENVFTYNQGVILSGQRGLWEATGNASYLEAGHELIRNVVRATGFRDDGAGAHDPTWAGLGRFGILEESCDAEGRCSQDGQTFKGIFFHHLAAFCHPLPVGSDHGVFHRASRELAFLHRSSCRSYATWVARNAHAALGTRDGHGVFGSWWLPGELDAVEALPAVPDSDPENDYRNNGVPRNERWMLPEQLAANDEEAVRQPASRVGSSAPHLERDPNERGRGRTVETQSGGVAVLKALKLFADLMVESDGPFR